ncbi:methyltransferase domain-containing protein [Candidatus Berkelbacteria bacterium]|nr:methyltransferase domain-containing protein [Candidatus Berkelbacteria bacterium]
MTHPPTLDATAHKAAQARLYDDHLLDDLAAGAGTFGFAKPKLIRDLAFERWLRRLELQPGQTVLDVGCNAGARLEQLRREFQTVGTGIDLSPASIAAGQRRFPALSLQTGDAEALPFPDATFDAAISFETFEHVPDPARVLAEMARIVRPGGRLLVYAISRRNALTWHWWLMKLSGGRLGCGALGDHQPELLVRPEVINGAARELGLVQLGRAPFHSFFTILYDEVVMHALSQLLLAVQPRRVEDSRTMALAAAGDRPVRPSWRFRLYRRWLAVVAGLTTLVDLPWRLLGLSDGVFWLFAKSTASGQGQS